MISNNSRGISSVGRATRWQRVGHRFKSVILHLLISGSTLKRVEPLFLLGFSPYLDHEYGQGVCTGVTDGLYHLQVIVQLVRKASQR